VTEKNANPERTAAALEAPTIHCVGGVISRDNKVLLGLRAGHKKLAPNSWDIFGGHVEVGETWEETLIRELHEELDITARTYRYVTAFDETDPGKNGPRRYHIYRVDAWDGAGPRLCGDEHVEMRWVTLGDALALDLAAAEYLELFAKIMSD
jgi:8-oxo-dGTP diphosphatase